MNIAVLALLFSLMIYPLPPWQVAAPEVPAAPPSESTSVPPSETPLETPAVPLFADSTIRYAAGSVFVKDAATGVILYASEAHTLRYPASITKVMTTLVVLEHVTDFSEVVTFSANAVRLPWYAFNLRLQAGDTQTVWTALHGNLIASGNEIARALAEHVSGCIEAFVDKMNARALELGAVNTRFANPCGLPAYDQHTTAYDMALILHEALQNPLFYEIFSAHYVYFPQTSSMPERRVRNINHLLREEGRYFNPRVVGGKTGFTLAAQNTIVLYARQGDYSIIVSILYSPDRSTLWSDANNVVNYIFARLDPYTEYAFHVFHTVARGESLSVIIRQHRSYVSPHCIQRIAYLNNIRNVNSIQVGQVIRIPLGYLM